MKTKKLTLRTLEHDDSIEVINKDILSAYTGGSDSYDCVLNCFDYLDGSANDYSTYYYNIFYNLGYTPESNGGVNSTDIPTIGGYGGMNVYELTGGSGSGVAITSSGTLTTGERIMLTYNAGVSGIQHAVVVTGTETEGGVTYLKFYDPTIGQPGRLAEGEYAALYAVGG